MVIFNHLLYSKFTVLTSFYWEVVLFQEDVLCKSVLLKIIQAASFINNIMKYMKQSRKFYFQSFQIHSSLNMYPKLFVCFVVAYLAAEISLQYGIMTM